MRRTRAFTLVELLVVIAVIGAILGVVFLSSVSLYRITRHTARLVQCVVRRLR